MTQKFDGEIWKDIDGYEGRYRVSNLGRVMSLFGKGKIFKGSICTYGYLSINLSLLKAQKLRKVHRLVAEHFLPSAPTDKHQVNHIDGVKTNNCVENLEWMTAIDNIRHAWKTGLCHGRKGCDNYRSKLTIEQVVAMRNEYSTGKITYNKLAIKYKLSIRSIEKVIKKISYQNIP